MKLGIKKARDLATGDVVRFGASERNAPYRATVVGIIRDEVVGELKVRFEAPDGEPWFRRYQDRDSVTVEWKP